MMDSSQEDLALQVLEVKEKILDQAISILSRIRQNIANHIVDDATKISETNNSPVFDSQEHNIKSVQDAYIIAVQAKADDLLGQHNVDFQKQLAAYANESMRIIIESYCDRCIQELSIAHHRKITDTNTKKLRLVDSLLRAYFELQISEIFDIINETGQSEITKRLLDLLFSENEKLHEKLIKIIVEI